MNRWPRIVRVFVATFVVILAGLRIVSADGDQIPSLGHVVTGDILDGLQAQASAAVPEGITKRHSIILLDIDIIVLPDPVPDFKTVDFSYTTEQRVVFAPFPGESYVLRNTSLSDGGTDITWQFEILDQEEKSIGYGVLYLSDAGPVVEMSLSGGRSYQSESIPGSDYSVLFEKDWDAISRKYSQHGATNPPPRTAEEREVDLQKWRETLNSDPDYANFKRQRDLLVEQEVRQQVAPKADDADPE